VVSRRENKESVAIVVKHLTLNGFSQLHCHHDAWVWTLPVVLSIFPKATGGLEAFNTFVMILSEQHPGAD